MIQLCRFGAVPKKTNERAHPRRKEATKRTHESNTVGYPKPQDPPPVQLDVENLPSHPAKAFKTKSTPYSISNKFEGVSCSPPKHNPRPVQHAHGNRTNS
uniref:Uncharacterized protein n=1 Tax=Proboscia inermis TaxID=420281 RepID=A0A7S0GC08_9STRA|mmetsp:Transcript_17611/g.17825  ORF Transcript_17611/g.17825 Transcript_17611/m.17825 type:complete len:100 (+) Transcript_17611:347-646(+)